MGLNTSTMTEERKRRFNRYLVFYGDEECLFGVKGISSEAPQEIIDEFVTWYRETTRYPNGRLRPMTSKMYSNVVISVNR